MLISIIIPCHNCETTIDRAVNSVLSQTHTDWELILVNNNSKDSTWEKLIHIKKNNPDKAITVLDEKKKGAPAARNKGLYEAKGEWIQFLDADDELLPEKIKSQVDCMDDKTDVIFSPYFDVLENNTSYNTQQVLKENIWEALMKGRIGITSANLFKKEKLIEVKGWDETVSSSQDTRLAFDLLKVGAFFTVLDRPLTRKYSSEMSITGTLESKKVKRLIINFINLRKDIMLFLTENKTENQIYREWYDYMFADIFLRFFKILPIYTVWEYNRKTKHSLFNRLKTNYSFLMLFMDRIFNKL